MAPRKEITKNEADGFARASKKVKGEVLDRLVAQFGCSRANTRRHLNNALNRRGPASAVKRKPSSSSYGYDTLKVLQRVWPVADRPCDKYLVPTMAATLENMEAHAAHRGLRPGARPLRPGGARAAPGYQSRND